LAKDTEIAWADSTVNAEMGCDGWELRDARLFAHSSAGSSSIELSAPRKPAD